ncbi:MAG: flavocytochrome c [Stomatobaculum sp.]|nr:flavocytochrome c [Stomatobaculum sp.]
MKKVVCAVILVVIALFLVKTCAVWTYEATVSGHNAPITVKVSMTGGRIKNVEVTKDSETTGVGKKAIEIITRRIVEEQSLSVDTVTGASITSRAILAAAEQAMQGGKVRTERFKNNTEARQTEDESLTADVIVVGGGGAGLAAAVSAEQHDARVLVLEKLDILGGSTNVSEGALNAVDPKRQKPQGIEDSVEKFIDQTWHGGHEKGDMELIRYLCGNSMESIKWLEDLGAVFKDTVSTATGALFPRSHYPATPSGNSYVRVFEDYVSSHEDLTVRTGVEVHSLTVEKGRITGVSGVKKDGGTVTASAPCVILATGGFGANKEMLKKYNTGVWAHVDLTALGCTNMVNCATGAGIEMAAAIGADVTGMSDIQVHPCGTPGTGLMENIRTSGRNRIFVNKEGSRFVNEGAARDVLAQAVLDQEDQTFWIVVNTVRYPSRDWVDENGSTIADMVSQGKVFEGRTLEELAEKTGMKAENLTASVSGYNAVVRGEKEDDFGFRADNPADVEMTEGPWYACRKVPTVHHTMGGLKINTDTEVLDTSGSPIPGLYAAGEVTGGIHGSNRLGGNAIADIMTFGKKAGEMAASYSAEY